MAPNLPALYELHFAVPMAGATLSALNVSLDEQALTIILHQLRPKIIFVDSELAHLVSKVIHNNNNTHLLENHHDHQPLLVTIHDVSLDRRTQWDLEVREYEQTVAMGESDFQAMSPTNECDPISVNFTSGSTGTPKAVAYSHRAAYLNSLGLILRYNMGKSPVFLWTVDMFRCNGWCFTWAMAELGGVDVCIRNVLAKIIFDSVQLHKVTHLCGKPTILNMIADSPPVDQKPLPSVVDVIIAGAFPTNPVLKRVQELGFDVVYGYGTTEALGPALIRPWRSTQHHHHDEDEDNDHDDHNLKCREGLHNITLEAADVKDPTNLQSVPSDGKTIGEIMLRGNTLMAGYVGDPDATQEAFSGGWYRTEDLGVRHSDGCIEVIDRARDIIVSGNNWISTLEIEGVLLSHPDVAEAAVVAPYTVVGQVPRAFVKLKEGRCSKTEEMAEFCADRLQEAAKVPKTVFFGDLPKNSTGNVQKSVLREREPMLVHRRSTAS
ncbi:probable acyl-activating enzyme 1, peroxisomal [Eucalyptus grandis]|uniref:probable acyl-activating enzyme 1, peroxisomal n=1 Tax=Eucalyptus grandis TaxID=71139 RepID=UPI00192E7627|nr:probable acyl-activating enzyme 1, peroxisomal [Eucalyptus grandis]